MTRYIPILKGKQGEYNALGDISPATREGLQPLIELVPSGESDDSDVQRAGSQKAMTKLALVWSARPLFLDAGHFDLTVDHGGGHGLTYDACSRLETAGVMAIPAVRLGDPPLAVEDVGNLHTDYHRGACIRLIADDLQEDGDVLESWIDQLLARASLTRPDIDLLIDAGHVDGDFAALTTARVVRIILREMTKLADFRTVTVAGGAFPDDLSDYPPDVLGVRQRYDADLWTNLVGRGTQRAVDYGDYAVAHPVLTEGGWRTSPQLRYTVDTSWLILKGRLNDPNGHAQFYDICDEIAAHPKFAGAALGPSDRRIANSRADGPGNATTWRQIGTAHHMDYVVARLTSLGEP